MRGADRVRAGHRADVAERAEQVAVGGDVRADVRRRAHAQGQKPAVGVERELRLADPVARVLVGEDRLAPLARPLHRPADPARRPEDEAVLRVLRPLRAETAAHVADDHADRRLRDAEDLGREEGARTMGVLKIRVERVACLAGVVVPDRAARLHELRVDAAHDVAPAHDARRARKGGVGRRPVAHLEHVRHVVRALVPYRCCARPRGVRRRRDRRQRLVVDRDLLRGVLGLRERFGDHECDRIADVAHAPAREPRMRPREHRRAVRALALEGERGRAEPLGGEVVAGQHRDHARGRRCRGDVDRADARAGVRRAQHDHVRLSGQVHVVDEPSLPAQEPRVFEPGDGLADAELAHAAPCLVGCLVVG